LSKPQSPQPTLFSAALAVQKNAHAPYSHYKVGSALLADDGGTYCGCNVENVASPLGQCAEGNAIAAMVAAGATKVREILIASPNSHFCTPCGGCRQRIFEFADQQTLIHLASSDGKIKTVTMQDILPLAFDRD
jgi:cytidine deaminase